MLHWSIGNPALLRLPGQRPVSFEGNEPPGHDAKLSGGLTARKARPAVSWDFNKIAVSAPDRAKPNHLAVPPQPGIGRRQHGVEEGADSLLHQAAPGAGQVVPTSGPSVSAARASARVGRNDVSCAQQQALQTKPIPTVNAPAALDVGTAVRATKRDGEPLPNALRSYFEPRFGHDFREVRVHADAEAAESARAVQARAFTLGRHIVFGSGEYAGATSEGKRLLAHELTHFVQQSPGAAPRLRRFTSPEHKSLGDEAAGGSHTDINMGTDAAPNYLTFGDAVALSGDYFGSLDEMRNLAATDGGRAKLRWVYWWAIEKDQHKTEPPLDDTAKQQMKDRYFTLASQNVSHFSAGGTAGNTYKEQHTKALQAAFDAGSAAGAGQQPDLTAARTQEAFAQHFLSDMFSAGHIRTERAAIKAWYDANMSQSIPQFVAYMAKKMHTYLEQKHSIAAHFGGLFIPDEADLQKQITNLGGKALQAFSLGDIVSLGYHNLDSMGLDVTSAADQSGQIVPGGSSWRAMGDAMLSQSPVTRGMAVAAMRASLHELDIMAMNGSTAPRGVYLDGGFGQALSNLGDFAALKYVPQAAATNHPLKWMWGFFNQRMYDAVDAAVKGDIVKNLREIIAEQKDENVRDALADFADLLEILGIAAIEQAVNEPARQKRWPLPGMYGYQAPGPDD